MMNFSLFAYVLAGFIYFLLRFLIFVLIKLRFLSLNNLNFNGLHMDDFIIIIYVLGNMMALALNLFYVECMFHIGFSYDVF